MDSIEALGFLAGLMIALSSLPQFVKSLKSKQTKDVSLWWLLINLTGQVLWVTYGFYKDSQSLMVMSAISFMMIFSVLVLKLKHG